MTRLDREDLPPGSFAEAGADLADAIEDLKDDIRKTLGYRLLERLVAFLARLMDPGA